jgi:tRNA/tmRNA/rRNA uracil-C5-methylase (TrmA/RlmC/RlmD family)
MLSELIDHGHAMLAMSKLLVDSARVGAPDPLVHTVLKLASLVSLQTMTIAKIIEELKKEGA